MGKRHRRKNDNQLLAAIQAASHRTLELRVYTLMKETFKWLLMAVMLQGCSDVKEQKFISGCQSTGMLTQVCTCIADELDGNLEHPSDRELFNASMSCHNSIFGK